MTVTEIKPKEEYVKDDPKSAKLIKEFDEKYLFIKMLIKRRQYLGLSQQEVADKAGLSLDDVIQIENIAADPKINILWKYCNALDITIITQTGVK